MPGWQNSARTKCREEVLKKCPKKSATKTDGLFIYICFDAAAVAAAALIVLGDLLHIWIYTVQYVN